jgi:hypothetical protein
MDQFLAKLLDGLANQGVVALLLFGAVYWLNQQNQRSENSFDKAWDHEH